MSLSPRNIRILYGIIAAALLLPLLAHAYNGTFSRLIADDYCTAAIGIAEGAFGGMRHWYMNWAGLYTNFAFKSAIAPFDPRFAGLLPVLTVAAWLAAAVWTLYQVARALRVQRPAATAFIFALLLIGGTLAGTPVIIQSLYWTGGAVPYSFPLIFMTLYLGVLVYSLRQPASQRLTVGAMIGGALLAFIAGGLSEVYVTVQLALIMVLLLLAAFGLPPAHRRRALLFLLASMVGAALALVLVLTAPGNEVRQAHYTSPTSLFDLVFKTVTATLSLLATSTLIFAPLALLVTLIFAGIMAYLIDPPQAIGRLSRSRVRLLLLVVALGTGALIGSAMTPGVYATGQAPPARVFIIPIFILMSGAACWGYIMGVSLRKALPANPQRPLPLWALVGIVILLTAGPLYGAWKAVEMTPTMQAYAAEWDARDAQIRADAEQGLQAVSVAPLENDVAAMVGLDTIDETPDEGINRCAADYYGIASLTAEPVAPTTSALPNRTFVGTGL